MASQVEMMSGKRKKDYAAESAAEALAAQAAVFGVEPQDHSIIAPSTAEADDETTDEGETADEGELVAA